MLCIIYTPSLMSTHQTSSNVLNGLLDVHAWPVVQHVTDTGRAVDKPDIIFTSLWHGVKTGSMNRHKKPQSQKSYINSLKWPECVQAHSEFKSCCQSKLRMMVLCLWPQVHLSQSESASANLCLRVCEYDYCKMIFSMPVSAQGSMRHEFHHQIVFF